MELDADKQKKRMGVDHARVRNNEKSTEMYINTFLSLFLSFLFVMCTSK